MTLSRRAVWAAPMPEKTRLPAPPRWRYWTFREQENLLQKGKYAWQNAARWPDEIAETHREIGDVRDWKRHDR